MAITLTPFEHGRLCHGCTWTITDENELARLVARVLLGQYRHVSKIIAGITATALPPDSRTIDNVIARLTVGPGRDPWHRDGLLFQTMSWIAARRGAEVGAITRPPQLIPADKGFDGLQVEWNDAGSKVAAAVIFEDKATANPRATIRDGVWPEFAKLETGEEQNRLMQEVTALLEMRQPNIDVDAAIESIVWNEVRRYRVSITVGDMHADPAGRERLFDGYEAVVAGAVARRRGEILHLPDLRAWMDQFAQRVEAALTAMVVVSV